MNTATAESTAQDTSVVLFDAAPTFKALLDDRERALHRLMEEKGGVARG